MAAEYIQETKHAIGNMFTPSPHPASMGCRTWMLWPARPDTWKENAGPAQVAFAAVAKAIAQFEAVVVGV